MGEIAVSALTDLEFTQYQQLIEGEVGIHLHAGKKALLHNRLCKRLRERKVSSFSEYYKLITSTQEQVELKTALELVTTNETYFFREPKHFEYLKHIVLKREDKEASFRVWSAACSSGEEAYSISMVLANCCMGDWGVVASDINDSVIKKAKLGIYQDVRTSGISDNFLHRFCRKGVGRYEGHLRMVPGLRSKISFQKINLNHSLPVMGMFDVVFLRNVMIYFTPETQKTVVSRVAKCIRPGGYLLLSHSESLHELSDQFEAIKPSIYRRKNAQR